MTRIANYRSLALLGLFGSIVSGCATAPRGPAGKLADAGISATSIFGSDVRDTAYRLETIDITDSFSATWERCNAQPAICAEVVKSDENYAARQQLIKVIKLRAVALDALSEAYTALKQEADYDAKADLEGATNEAIKGVNNFASAVAAIAGAAPGASILTETLGPVVSLGAGLLADSKQKKRLIAGSIAIKEATLRLKQALEVEKFIFDSLGAYAVLNRTNARLALLDAGLVSNTDILVPLAADLNMKLLPNTEATVTKSKAAQTAVRAMVQAISRTEVTQVQNKYGASIDALDALIKAHGDFEKERNMSLADVQRLLAELDAALETETKE